jgi:purine-binding chemotaxis protein CheW
VVEATSIREIVSLPEIHRLEEAPNYVAGFLYLRGQIVLVIDLLVRFGQHSQPYSLADSIVILEASGGLVAVLIKVPQVIKIAVNETAGQSVLCREAETATKSAFICGLLEWEGQVAMRLNVENLVSVTRDQTEHLDESSAPGTAIGFPTSVEAKAVLRERAQLLAQTTAHERSDGLIPFAVVGLGGEFFGIELQAVKEFCNVRNVAPIPGCPPHIIGQMSVRGDLITVVDISSFVGVPPMQKRDDRKLVVIRDSMLGAGVLVDELLDVIQHPAEDMKPTNRGSQGLGREHFRGTAAHGSKTLTLLDLSALLAHVSLQVNETVI